MTWTPGRPVRTAEDHAVWQAWRRDRKRQQQQHRRALYPRIDYYPDPDAAALIYRMTQPRTGHDLSSVINRMVSEWAEHCHRNKQPESRSTPTSDAASTT